VNSRDKGCRGERELADFLRKRGWDARRGQQHSGSPDSPDVISNLPGIHLECKRVEKGQIYDWLAQAKRDCGEKVPVVAHKRNRQEWVAVLPLADLLNLILCTGAA
jgi:Holliday junction resolvase